MSYDYENGFEDEFADDLVEEAEILDEAESEKTIKDDHEVVVEEE